MAKESTAVKSNHPGEDQDNENEDKRRPSLPQLRESRRISAGGSRLLTNSDSTKTFTVTRKKSSNSHSSETYITSLIDDIRYSLRWCGANPTNQQLESWAILIHECLSGESRRFHSVHHVFEISAGSGPMQMLAACFRDTVNSTTDGGIQPILRDHLRGVYCSEKNTISDNLQNDQVMSLCMDIFGLKPGQDVSSYRGLNIFLSGVLMATTFREILTLDKLAIILTIMEATIPFRGVDGNGKGPLDRLYGRLTKISEKYLLAELDEAARIDIIQRAADFSNRNLGNFASDDHAFFLDHTWSLLPERSAALRRSYLYTVNDLCMATKEMEEFLSTLDLGMIFLSFHGIPTAEEMEEYHKLTATNLQKGCTYMRAKLLSVVVISAFATLTGGDAPMSFFMGDLPSRNQQSDRLGETFPKFRFKDLNGCDEDVYNLLNKGRNLDQTFDTRNAPLGAYLYGILGDEGVASALDKCEFPMTDRSSRALLQYLPTETIKLIGNEIAQIAISREEAILDPDPSVQ